MKYDQISAHLNNTHIPRTSFNINQLINIYLISIHLISTQVMNTHRHAGGSMYGCGCGLLGVCSGSLYSHQHLSTPTPYCSINSLATKTQSRLCNRYEMENELE